MSSICNDLRAAILQAAMQGKLTIQSPDDGDIESQIGDIPSEMGQTIPNNWREVKLGHIAKMGMGKTILKSQMKESGIPVYSATISDEHLGYIDKTDLILKKDDIVIPARGNSIGWATLVKEPQATCTQTTIYCINIKLFILPKFLWYCCYAFKSDWFKYDGSAIPQITVGKLKDINVPIPPLAEQGRIIKKVDELMARVADLEQSGDALASLKKAFPDDIKASLLQAAMQGKLTEQLPEDGDAEKLLNQIKDEKEKLIAEGKIKKQKPLAPITDDEIPFNIPENWKWVRMDNIFNIHSSIRVHQSDWKTSGIPFFRGRELVRLARDGDVDPEIFISKELYEEKKQRGGVPQKDDILVSAVGTIGKVYIVKGDRPFYYKDAYVLCFDNIGNITPRFIKYAIEAPCINDVIMRGSMGTTVAQLTIDKAKKLLIPLPPLSEQKRIVERLDSLVQNINMVGELIANE